MIRKFYQKQNQLRGIVFNVQWFMQDGAPPHSANKSLALLREKFGERFIASKTNIPWASHSPDLNPLDFFLWGYAKDNVYKCRPADCQALKKSIGEFICGIPSDMCERVIGNFEERITTCIKRNGDHMEYVL